MSASLALQNWGGGAFCADNYLHLPTTRTCYLPLANGTISTTPSQCWTGPGALCGDRTKTEVFLPFGSQQYIGLGFIVFFTIIFLEIFGSPFMRNASVIIALLFGYLIAACIKYQGKRYVITDKIDAAPGITFLWTKTFPLGFYAPAVIPLMIVFIITSIETVGDTTATLEASRMVTVGEDFTRRVKGALLNDGISGIFSALATSLPLTTFAQNNGVISLTNVASRQAGFSAALWLFLLGILGKIGAWITTIPEAVLGGMSECLVGRCGWGCWSSLMLPQWGCVDYDHPQGCAWRHECVVGWCGATDKSRAAQRGNRCTTFALKCSTPTEGYSSCALPTTAVSPPAAYALLLSLPHPEPYL